MGEAESTAASEQVVKRRGVSGLGLGIAVVAIVAVGALLARPTGDRSATTARSPDSRSAPTTSVPIGTAAGDPVGGGDDGTERGVGAEVDAGSGADAGSGVDPPPLAHGSARAMAEGVVDDLRGLADLDLAVSAVVTTDRGIEPRLVSVNASGDVLVAPVPESSRFVFDRSGRWLAGISEPDGDQSQAILWAGPVGGIFEPVAIGIDGFAWHESRDGLLGWSRSSPTAPELVSWTFAEGELRRWELPLAGHLEGWGEWGFAVAADGTQPTTVFLDPDARVIDDPLPGHYRGYLPGHGILLTGGRQLRTGAEGPAVLFDPWSRGLQPIAWLGADDAVWSARASPDEDGALVVVARGEPSGPDRGEIVLVTGDRSITVVATTGSVGEVAWSRDNTRVVFAERQVSDVDEPSRLLSLAPDGDRIEVALPDLFQGVELVAALSVR